jgi:hypothetical protein
VDRENNVKHHLHSFCAELYLATTCAIVTTLTRMAQSYPTSKQTMLEPPITPKAAMISPKISVYSGLIQSCSLAPSRISSFACQMLSNLCEGMVNVTCCATEN